MKMSDIIAETTAQKTRDEEAFDEFISRPDAADRKLITPVRDYMNKGYSFTHAYLKATRDAAQETSRSSQQQDKPRDKKPADKPTKPEKPSRASRFATVGADATKQATGAISKAWQRGERWSRALGIPKPKKKKD